MITYNTAVQRVAETLGVILWWYKELWEYNFQSQCIHRRQKTKEL